VPPLLHTRPTSLHKLALSLSLLVSTSLAEGVEVGEETPLAIGFVQPCPNIVLGTPQPVCLRPTKLGTTIQSQLIPGMALETLEGQPYRRSLKPSAMSTPGVSGVVTGDRTSSQLLPDLLLPKPGSLQSQATSPLPEPEPGTTVPPTDLPQPYTVN
jgi:hypothetical protein